MAKMKKLTDYLFVTVKGICMGAADVIPGVSGGTIAFMTGIYEELVGSINAINTTAMKLLFSGKFKEFWKHINGNFLLSLIAGILVSILSLAKLMTYLLEHHPVQTWAFFFGLIVASSIFILKDIKGWKFRDIVMLAIGIVTGAVVCTLSPTETPDGLWFIFLCGAIAICAMILPGISGSFILLILGKYEYMMGTVAKIVSGDGVPMDFVILIIFAAGALAGIIAFSKFLHWLLAGYHRPTLLALAGFIIGSRCQKEQDHQEDGDHQRIGKRRIPSAFYQHSDPVSGQADKYSRCRRIKNHFFQHVFFLLFLIS